MVSLSCLITVLVFVNLLTAKHAKSVTTMNTLQLLHVLFRHGERTTDVTTLYPKDPYINETYYPYGRGELTNEGKQRQYELGRTFRKRYNEFLGDIYIPDLLEAWSSDMSRTKASLQLTLAGLFPPAKEQIWHSGVNWQPIPFNTLSINQDSLFFGILQPTFKKYHAEIMESPKIRKEFERNSELLEYLSKHTGKNIKSYWDMFLLYACLTTEMEYGLTLPEWTRKVYPQPLKDFAIRSYEINTCSVEMRRIASGYLLKKIVDDSKAKINSFSKRKIFLYSGHEFSIAHMLNTLEVFKPHIPPYGSYILLELHNINNVDGFKIFYQDNNSFEPKLIRLPGCNEFCPLDQFISLTEEYFPEEDSSKSKT